MDRTVYLMNHLPNTNSLESHLDFLNMVMAYQGNAGKLVDNLRKCFTEICPDIDVMEVTINLKEATDKRNFYLHGHKMPLLFDDKGTVLIPLIDYSGGVGYTYGENKPWSQVDPSQVTALIRDFDISFNDLLQSVNECIGKLNDCVLMYIEEKSIYIQPPSLPRYSRYTYDIREGYQSIPYTGIFAFTSGTQST